MTTQSIRVPKTWRHPLWGSTFLVLLSITLFCRYTAAQSCTTPASGATINSSGATPIYVDGTLGSNTSMCGSSTSPCKTIQQGLVQASTHTVSDVIIKPGTYRETLSLPTTYNENGTQTLIVEAATPGTVTIEGADQWTGWTDNGNGTFTLSWAHTWGYALQPFTGSGGPALGCSALRREMVFVNSTQLTQLLQGPLATAGTFFVVDGQSDPNVGSTCPALTGTSNNITIYPPAGTNMATADVEVAVRQTLFTTPNGMQNLKLKGLTFQHDNSAANSSGFGAVHITGNDAVNKGANILVDTLTIKSNNWIGLDLGGNFNVTVKNSTFAQNGENGLEVYRPKNFLFTNNTVTFNNWRGYSGGLTGWDASGMKIVKGHTVEVDNSSFSNNKTGGLWFDYDNRQICIQGSQFEQNLTNGLFVEASEGPVLIYQNQICHNTQQGLQTANSESVTVRQSAIYDNGQNAFFIGGQSSRAATDWETGAVYNLQLHNWVFDGDNFATGPDTVAGAYLLSSSLRNISTLTSTILSNYNDWYAPNNTTPFNVPGQGGPQTFAQWQNLTHTDAISNQNAVTSCALPAASPCIGSDCSGGDGTVTLVIANSGAAEKFKVQNVNTLAQSFVVPSGVTKMTGVQIGLAKTCSGCADHSTTVSLRTSLTGSDVWMSTFTPTVSSSDYKNPGFVTVPVPTAFAVTAGNTYYLVVTTSNTSTTDYYYWSTTATQVYTQGFFYSNGTKKFYSAYATLTFTP